MFLDFIKNITAKVHSIDISVIAGKWLMEMNNFVDRLGFYIDYILDMLYNICQLTLKKGGFIK